MQQNARNNTNIFCCSTRFTSHETDSLQTHQRNFGNFSFFLLSRARADSVIAIPAQAKVLYEPRYALVHTQRIESWTEKAGESEALAEFELFGSCSCVSVCSCVRALCCVCCFIVYRQLRQNQGLPIPLQRICRFYPLHIRTPILVELPCTKPNFLQIEYVVFVMSVDLFLNACGCLRACRCVCCVVSVLHASQYSHFRYVAFLNFAFKPQTHLRIHGFRSYRTEW